MALLRWINRLLTWSSPEPEPEPSRFGADAAHHRASQEAADEWERAVVVEKGRPRVL